MDQLKLTILDGLTDMSYPWTTFEGLPPIPEKQIPKCNLFYANNSYQACGREGKLDPSSVKPVLIELQNI